MLSVLLNWIYVLMITYILGYGTLKYLYKLTKSEKKPSIKSSLASGFVFCITYSQFFSLFYKVGLLANIILLVLTIIITFAERKELSDLLSKTSKLFLQHSMWRKIFTLCIFSFISILFLYATSTGYFHYDSDLYHGQSIRWIEEYGIVKGLGNLHNRLAYNSSFFCLSALFSFSFIGVQSLHTLSGLLSLLMFLYGINLTAWKNDPKIYCSDLCKIGLLFYIGLYFSGIVAPASDYSVTYCIFYIIISWIELLERKDVDPVAYGLLCVLCVIAITLKLSVGCILIIMLKPAIQLIKQKRMKEIVFFILLGLLCIVPFLIRNVLISGYLIYPLSSIDLFSVDWKMPASTVIYDSQEIQVWGRGIHDVGRFDESVLQWGPVWFSNLKTIEKLFFILNGMIIMTEPFLIFRSIQKKNVVQQNYLLVLFAITISYLSWFFSAPLYRYGYAYILLLMSLGVGTFLYNRKWQPRYHYLITAIFCLVLLYGIRNNITYYRNHLSFCFITQQDYTNYPVKTFILSQTKIYYPVEGDQVGYNPFPATTRIREDLQLRGDSIKNGFQIKNYF